MRFSPFQDGTNLAVRVNIDFVRRCATLLVLFVGTPHDCHSRPTNFVCVVMCQASHECRIAVVEFYRNMTWRVLLAAHDFRRVSVSVRLGVSVCLCLRACAFPRLMPACRHLLLRHHKLRRDWRIMVDRGRSIRFETFC